MECGKSICIYLKSNQKFLHISFYLLSLGPVYQCFFTNEKLSQITNKMVIYRYQLPHILGLVCGVMSVVVILWTDVQDGKWVTPTQPEYANLSLLISRGGVTAGGEDRMTGDSIALLSAALTGIMQVQSDIKQEK